MTITEISIKRPTLVVVVFSFLAVLGIYGFLNLKYELMPKMTIPYVIVTTIYPGASPSEVENSVTRVVEDAVSGMENLASIKSSSYEGRSLIRLELNANTDVDLALQDAQRKISEIADKLPRTAFKPVVSKIAFDELPVLRMSIVSNMPPREFYQFVVDKIQPRISKIEGVGSVSLIGGEKREIRVNFFLDKLKTLNLSLFQVTQYLKNSNLDFPTGKVKDTDAQYIVRVAGKFENLEEIRDIVIGKSKLGGEIKLREVADVDDYRKEIESINRLNGIPSLGMIVQKTTDANTVDVSKQVRNEIAKLEKEYNDIKLHFDIAQDASEFTLESANAVEKDLAIAVILVAVVMLVFLHSIRNSFIVMVAIPASLISTFFLMYIFDFTLNLMTLLAMSLVIGILVDDSIVVIENIYRHLEMGEEKRSAALKGRNEIGFAALSITLVDVVVFVPMAMITGVIGNFLRQYALVVVFSTLMSLFVSFTITPALASRFSKLQSLTKDTFMGRFGLLVERLYEKVTSNYIKVLKWSLNNGGKVAMISFLLFVFALLLPRLGFIGTEFMPDVDRGEFTITLELDAGVNIEQTNYIAQEVENLLNQREDVEKILTNVGTSSEGIIGLFSNNSAEINVRVVNKDRRQKGIDEIGMEIKKEIQKIPGVRVRVNSVSITGVTTQTPIQILITGADFSDVNKAAKQIMEIVKSVEGTTDVRLSSEEGKPEYRVELDREKMALYGLTVNDVGQVLRIALTGDDDIKFRQGVTDYDMRIVLDESDRNKTVTLENLTFTNPRGQLIELKQFAKLYQSTGPTKLERENRITSINLFSQVFGRASGDVASDIRNKLQNIKLPPGVNWEFTGQQKYMASSFQSLIIALITGILFVYMIMVALYDSYLYPFVVLFSIPLAAVGAMLALALTMKTISVYSMMGIIMLVGLVAKNAILLVDRTNQMKIEKDYTTYEALLEAGKTRLRPILMTTFAMVMGMLPIAISTSAGSETKSGLGVVLIGGLLSSMFLTLILVPVVYQRFDKWKILLLKKFFKYTTQHKALETKSK